MKKIISLLMITLITLALSSCAEDYDSNSYSDASAGQAQTVRYGVITQTQPVTLNSDGDKTVGLLAGGAAGAILGSRLGGGSTANSLGGLAGGLAGAIAGSAVGNHAGKQNGIQYIIKLDTGDSLSVVQGTQPTLNVGQRVMILTGSDARDRIVADTSTPTQTNSTKNNTTKNNTTQNSNN